MRKLTKLLGVSFICCVIVSAAVGLSACETKYTYGESDCGFFKTTTYDGYGPYLNALTELGKQQTELTVPTHVNGVPIRGFNRTAQIGGIGCAWRSEVLEKITIPNFRELGFQVGTSGSPFHIFIAAPNLKEIVALDPLTTYGHDYDGWRVTI
jgi:hypothetical protein